MTIRADVAALLGPDWDGADLNLEDNQFDKAIGLYRLRFRTGEGELVRALHLPSKTGASLLYCHAHGNRYDIGMSELIEGRPALSAPWLPVFAEKGWGALCLEMPCFGERAVTTESALAKQRLWHGRTLFGQMLGEQRAACRWLAETPDVDREKIAVIGISMGGTLAWWLAALQGDFAAAVSIACFADLQTLIETGAHDGHGIYMTVPGLLPLISTGQLCGFAAPTPLMHCVGFEDWSTPKKAFEIAQRDVTAAYDRALASRHLRFLAVPSAGHEETVEMRSGIIEFLEEFLT